MNIIIIGKVVVLASVPDSHCQKSYLPSKAEGNSVCRFPTSTFFYVLVGNHKIVMLQLKQVILRGQECFFFHEIFKISVFIIVNC